MRSGTPMGTAAHASTASCPVRHRLLADLLGGLAAVVLLIAVLTDTFALVLLAAALLVLMVGASLD